LFQQLLPHVGVVLPDINGLLLPQQHAIPLVHALVLVLLTLLDVQSFPLLQFAQQPHQDTPFHQLVSFQLVQQLELHALEVQ
jgi:hypothetical protein